MPGEKADTTEEVKRLIEQIEKKDGMRQEELLEAIRQSSGQDEEKEEIEQELRERINSGELSVTFDWEYRAG